MSGNQLYLICDNFGPVSMQLLEGKAQYNGRIKFSGPFTECERANRNNRVYPSEVMEPEFNRLKMIAEKKGLIGELDHPDDSVLRLERGSHLINKMWWESKNVGWGQAVTIPTPFGMTLEAYFHEGVPVGVSSRGVGSGKQNEYGQLVIQPNYRCITYDTVADPSYQDAWQAIRESIMDDFAKGRKKVSFATPDAIAKSQGYDGSVVSTRIEESLGESSESGADRQESSGDIVDRLFNTLSEIIDNV